MGGQLTPRTPKSKEKQQAHLLRKFCSQIARRHIRSKGAWWWWMQRGGKEEAREALDQLAPRKMTSTIEVAVTDDASGELL